MKSIVSVLLAFFFFTSFIFSQTIQWEQLSGPHGGGIYSIVKDNSGNIYVSAIGNAGPFKSTDNGETWFSIKNGLTPGDNGGLHPLNINTNGDLFIGGANNTTGTCRSTDGGASWTFLSNLIHPICIAFDADDNVYVGTQSGIYKSTDNGDNWSLYGNFTSQTEAIAFNDSGHVFAGTSYAVYRSTDDGANWTQLPTGGGTRTVAVAPNGYVFAGCWENAGILRSTDNGDSWSYSYPQTVQIRSASTILFDDNGDIYFPTYGKGVLKSTDDGDSWIELNEGLGYKYLRAITKNINGSFFTGGDYALYKTNSAGTSWYSVGLPVCTVNKIAINSNDDIFAGVWGVNRSIDRGLTWETINSGLGNYEITSIVIKQDSVIFIGCAGTWYANLPRVLRSTDNGDTWVQTDNGLQNVRVGSMTIDADGNIYAGGYENGVYKSTNNGDSWVNIGGAAYAKGLQFNSLGDLFLASWGGGFWKLPAGDTTWVNLTSNIGASWIGTMFIDSNDYIYAEGKRSEDNGETWIQMGSTGHGASAYAENSIGELFCGTMNFGSGVFRSTDHGDNWTAINTGLPTLDIRSIAIDSEDFLYAGPLGYSLFKTTTSTVTSVEEDRTIPTSFSLEQNFPNPFNPSTTISWQSPIGSHQTIKVFDVLGNEIATLVDEYRSAGRYQVEFNASSLTSGVYFYQLKSGNYIQTCKMILLK